MAYFAQPRRLTLYTTVLLSSILIFMSSKMFYQASVYEVARKLKTEPLADPLRGGHGGQDENVYDFDDFEGDQDPLVLGDNKFSTEEDNGLKQDGVQYGELQLQQLVDETKALRNAVQGQDGANTGPGRHYLKDYIASLDALTAKHENLLREFNQMKGNENFTKFVKRRGGELNIDDINVMPVKHGVKTLNLSQLNLSSPGTRSEKQCKTPIQNVAFVKVHKAGSTTMQNVLQRYALRNNLNVALPNKDKFKDPHYHYLGVNGKISKSDLIPIPSNETYNMLFNHAVFNSEDFQAVLPADTFYLAIIREPEDRFISAAFFYGLVKRLYTMVPDLNSTRYVFTSYLQNPRKYIVNHYFYNAMSYDFGVPQSIYDKPRELFAYAKLLAQEFDLVMLLEYFDHSLVLLKRRLCWDFKDILYLSRNKGAKSGSNHFLLSENDKVLLRNWQTAEFVLYKVLSHAFWSKVSEEGDGFYSEVAHFKDIIGYVRAFCLNPMRRGDLEVKQSPWNAAFVVTKGDCKQMSAKEVVLHDVLVEKQRAHYWNKTNVQ